MKISRSTSPDPQPVGSTKKRRHLSAGKKSEVYLEAQHPSQPVGTILRQEGLFSIDLALIRQQVKEDALQRLQRRAQNQQRQTTNEKTRKLERFQ